MSWLTLRSSTPNKFSVKILKSMQCGFSVSRYTFVLIVQEADVGSLANVLDSLAIGRVVHKLKERTLRLVTGALGPAHPVELNVFLNNT